MFRLFRNCRLSTTINHFKMISDSKSIYTVDLLKEKANGYLEANDSAHACKMSYEACELALLGYVKKLEMTSGIMIVPEKLNNPWNYNMLSKLCRLIQAKVDPDSALRIKHGWVQAFEFHVRGWTENDLPVEEVASCLPYVFRFLDIVEKLQPDEKMALFVKENLFNLNLDKLAKDINKEAKDGKINLILLNINMRKDLRKELNFIYFKKYGEGLAEVLFKNKNACEQHFSK